MTRDLAPEAYDESACIGVHGSSDSSFHALMVVTVLILCYIWAANWNFSIILSERSVPRIQ